jgi:hypothetical protein
LPAIEFVAVLGENAPDGVESLEPVVAVGSHWDGHVMMLRGAVRGGVERHR